jgi:signal transduction histidine kinase
MRDRPAVPFSERLRHRLGAAYQAVLELLYRRTIVVLAIALMMGVVLVLVHVHRLQDRLVDTAATQGAALHSDMFEAVRTLYTSEVVDRVMPKDIEVTHEYLARPHAIPLPATFTMKIGEHISAADTGMQVRLYSDFPFRFRKRPALDAFDQAALDYLRRHPDDSFVRREHLNGRPVLRYATADRMRPQCVHCHNTHPDSPKTWQVDDVRGVLEIIRPLDPVIAQTRVDFQGTLVLVVGMSALGLSGLVLVLGKLRRTAVELEQRVDDRTTSLRLANERLAEEVKEHEQTEAELKRTGAELARSNRDLEQFAYLASHDLQEPLRMVASFTQLLARRYEGRLDADADDFIRFALDGAVRMQQLIQDLLEYARLGKAEPAPALVDCADALQAALGNLRATLEESGAIVTYGDLPTVRGVSSQLVQLLQNLIANAVRFRSAAPPEIHIEARLVDDEWRFSVRDNGIGIDPQYAERIFLPFERLHSRADYPGTGIGLAICKRIVERHGGHLGVESAPGRGSTFFFTLPRQGA